MNEEATLRILQKAASKVKYTHLIPLLNQQSDLPYALVKGEALSVQAYGSVGRRQSSDIDILVEKNDLKQWETALQENGFQTMALTRQEQIIARAFSHQIPPYRKKLPLGTLEVDLNFELLWGEWEGLKPQVSDMLARREWLTIYEQQTPVLCTTDAFIQLCLHHYKDMNSLFHLAQHNAITHKSFQDIAAFWNHNRRVLQAQKAAITEWLARYQLTPYVYYMLYWTHKIENAPELGYWAAELETPQGKALLESFGLNEKERKTWALPMEQRLENAQLSAWVRSQMTPADTEKLQQNMKIFGGL